MEKKLVEEIPLKNGLTVALYDGSRRVAGDRWLVSFWACVDVDVDAKYFEDRKVPDASFDEVSKAVGAKATYAFEKRTNFVEEEKREAVFQKLRTEYLETNMGYLSGPDFARRLILRRFREIQERPPQVKPA